MPKGATMAPYKIFSSGGKYQVKNNAGDVKATFDDRPSAIKYLRALYVNVKGAAEQAEKKKFTGKQKRAVKASAETAVERVLRLSGRA